MWLSHYTHCTGSAVDRVPGIVLEASQELGHRLADSDPLLWSVVDMADMRLKELHSCGCQNKQKSEGGPDVAGSFVEAIGSLVPEGTMADSSAAVMGHSSVENSLDLYSWAALEVPVGRQAEVVVDIDQVAGEH